MRCELCCFVQHRIRAMHRQVSLRCERPEYPLTRHRSALQHTVQPVMCIRRSCLFRRAVALQIPLSEFSLVLGTGKVRHLGLWSESMAPCSPVLRFRISEVRCLCVQEHSGALSSDFLRVAFARSRSAGLPFPPTYRTFGCCPAMSRPRLPMFDVRSVTIVLIKLTRDTIVIVSLSSLGLLQHSTATQG